MYSTTPLSCTPTRPVAAEYSSLRNQPTAESCTDLRGEYIGPRTCARCVESGAKSINVPLPELVGLVVVSAVCTANRPAIGRELAGTYRAAVRATFGSHAVAGSSSAGGAARMQLVSSATHVSQRGFISIVSESVARASSS